MNKTEVLKTYFGYDSFRKGQENVIDGLLAGKDVVAIMPTGAGKSLCYQVPALLFSGITLVISPLISLMQDQVKSLNEAGVHAAYINSSLTETQISKALALAARGTYQIIYVAPERLESAAFMHFVSQVKISMVTVDEAHCISQWGQDFRPGYLKIVEFIESLPERPVVSAFTATATEEVKEDIACILKLKNPEIIVTGFDRENLYYSVEHIAGKRKDVFVMDYLKKHPRESGIIYCATRKNVDALYEILCKQGIAAARYHAGMDNGERKKSQENFIYDRAPVIVATNAFGIFMMRSFFVSLPKGLEEAGRIDGAGEFRIFGKIMVPLCKPAIVSLFIFHFMYQWNDLLYPLLMTTDERRKTLPAGLATFMGTHVVEYGVIMAGACLSLLPILIAYLVAQKQFVQGIAMTGMKG